MGAEHCQVESEPSGQGDTNTRPWDSHRAPSHPSTSVNLSASLTGGQGRILNPPLQMGKLRPRGWVWQQRVTESGSGRGLSSEGRFSSLSALPLPTPRPSPRGKPDPALPAGESCSRRCGPGGQGPGCRAPQRMHSWPASRGANLDLRPQLPLTPPSGKAPWQVGRTPSCPLPVGSEQPRLLPAELRERSGSHPPTGAPPLGLESWAEASSVKELFLGCLIQKKGQQEQREDGETAASVQPQPLSDLPTPEPHRNRPCGPSPAPHCPILTHSLSLKAPPPPRAVCWGKECSPQREVAGTW